MTQFSITPPAPVQTALDMLCAAGFEAYIVGGCVRDALRGTEPHDWDCTTNAKPQEICECFRGFHVIETGLQHGTVTVVIEHNPIEITTYRIDGVYADHRRVAQAAGVYHGAVPADRHRKIGQGRIERLLRTERRDVLVQLSVQYARFFAGGMYAEKKVHRLLRLCFCAYRITKTPA